MADLILALFIGLPIVFLLVSMATAATVRRCPCCGTDMWTFGDKLYCPRCRRYFSITLFGKYKEIQVKNGI